MIKYSHIILINLIVIQNNFKVTKCPAALSKVSLSNLKIEVIRYMILIKIILN